MYIREPKRDRESDIDEYSPTSKRKRFKVQDDGPHFKKFSNFDILWYDLETKVRDLVLQLVQPMNDNVFDTRGMLAQQSEVIKTSTAKIEHLETIVFDKKVDKGEELDIFDRLANRISEVDVDRRRVESGLRTDILKCLDKFEDYKFIFDQHDKQMRNINENINLISQQTHDFKDHVDNENKRMMAIFSKINKGFMDDLADVRVEFKQVHKLLDKLKIEQTKTDRRQEDEIIKLKEATEQIFQVQNEI